MVSSTKQIVCTGFADCISLKFIVSLPLLTLLLLLHQPICPVLPFWGEQISLQQLLPSGTILLYLPSLSGLQSFSDIFWSYTFFLLPVTPRGMILWLSALFSTECLHPTVVFCEVFIIRNQENGEMLHESKCYERDSEQLKPVAPYLLSPCWEKNIVSLCFGSFQPGVLVWPRCEVAFPKCSASFSRSMKNA